MCGFHHSSNSIEKDAALRKQADDEKGFVRKVKEETGMDNDACGFEQRNRQIFFRARGGHPEDR
jgi:hypothetical protein